MEKENKCQSQVLKQREKHIVNVNIKLYKKVELNTHL